MNQTENNNSNVIQIEDTQEIEPDRVDNQNVIEINDEEILTHVNLGEHDDDVIMMLQNIEIIDLCSEAQVPFRNRVNVNEVIEIVDNRAPSTLQSSRGRAFSRTGRATTRTSPYERENSQTGSSQGIQGSCPICFETYFEKKDQMMSTK